MTTKEVAVKLRRTPRFVRAMAKNPTSGLAGRRVGKDWLFKRVDVVQFIASIGKPLTTMEPS